MFDLYLFDSVVSETDDAVILKLPFATVTEVRFFFEVDSMV